MPRNIKKLLKIKRNTYAALKKKQATKKEYQKAEKAYKQAVKTSNARYEQKISRSNNKNLLYGYMKKKLKSKNAIPPLRSEDGVTVTESKKKANLLNDAFQSVYTHDDANLPILTAPCNNITPMDWTVISPADVQFAIKKLKMSVSRTPDDIPSIILKKCMYNLIIPLTMLFNYSLSAKSLPKLWKEAIVIPIHKKGLKNSIKNYRPISLTSAICRVMETILQHKLLEHFLNNNIINKNQYGFLPGKSTLSQHLDLIDQLTRNHDNKIHTEMIYLDFSKAFDRVSHQKLLHLLNQLKVDPQIYNWIKNYLHERRQRTVVEDTFSAYSNITSGVPQGSVLGPTLFLIYVNNLINLLQEKVSTSVKVYAFADDLKLLSNDTQELQKSLDIIQNWTENWQLPLQTAKSEQISFNSQKHNINLQQTNKLKINGELFNHTGIVKDLGLLLNNDLKWANHIQNIQLKANNISYNT